jgi:cell division protein FtsN
MHVGVGVGARYTIQLAVRSEKDALAELALFERSRATYKAEQPSTRGAAAAQQRMVREAAQDVAQARAETSALCIDTDSLQVVLGHLRRRREAEEHVRSVRRYLVQCGNALKGRGLSTIRVDELVRLRDTGPQRGATALQL